MNIIHIFYFSLASILLISCSNNRIVIDQKELKNDWISDDNKFMLIDDSLLCSNISHLDRLIYRFELSNDTFTIYSLPDFENKAKRVLKYKITELDSVRLKIKGITLNDTAIIQFRKISAIKKNNLTIKTIDFSSGPCFGYCPVIDLKITEDSILYLHGYRFVKHKGLFKHRLSTQEFRRIHNIVNSICPDSVKLSPTCPDAQNLSLFMKTDNDSINVSGRIDGPINFRLIVLLSYMESLDKLLVMSKSDDTCVLFKDNFNSNWYKMTKKK